MADPPVDSVTPTMREFLTWISSRRRSYRETMDAWRTTCPRHTLWEDALAGGLIRVHGGPPSQAEVALTTRGRAALEREQARAG